MRGTFSFVNLMLPMKLGTSNVRLGLGLQYGKFNAACKKHKNLILNKSVSYSQNGRSIYTGKPFNNIEKNSIQYRNRTVVFYLTGMTVLVGGLTYASVPLYRMYCQATGKGGKAVLDEATEKIEKMQKVPHRLITVHFNADISGMAWDFKPQQREIKVIPGETALAFYTATNPTDVPIIGISTYNILPFEAGLYFNKIQCFCFEEQRLNPHEQVDMPVFFYIDPEFAENPFLENVDLITLSYTFFEAKKGFKLPIPTIR